MTYNDIGLWLAVAAVAFAWWSLWSSARAVGGGDDAVVPVDGEPVGHANAIVQLRNARASAQVDETDLSRAYHEAWRLGRSGVVDNDAAAVLTSAEAMQRVVSLAKAQSVSSDDNQRDETFETGLLVNLVELSYAAPDSVKRLGLISDAIEASDVAHRFLQKADDGGGRTWDAARVTFMGLVLRLRAGCAFSDDSQVHAACDAVLKFVTDNGADWPQLKVPGEEALYEALAQRDVSGRSSFAREHADLSWRGMIDRLTEIAKVGHADPALTRRLKVLQGRAEWQCFNASGQTVNLDHACRHFGDVDFDAVPVDAAVEAAKTFATHGMEHKSVASSRRAMALFARDAVRATGVTYLEDAEACLLVLNETDDGQEQDASAEQARHVLASWGNAHGELHKVMKQDLLRWFDASLQLADATGEIGDSKTADERGQRVLDQWAELSEAQRVRVASGLGELLSARSDVSTDTGDAQRAVLQRSAELFQRAVEVLDRGDAPFRWAKLHMDLGDVRARLAHVHGPLAEFDAAASAYRSALTVFSVRHAPRRRTRALLKLGQVLQDQARYVQTQHATGEMRPSCAGSDKSPADILEASIGRLKEAHDLSALDGLDDLEPVCRQRLEQAVNLAHSL